MNLSDVALLAKEELSLAEKGIASAKVVLTGFVVVFAMLILLIIIIKVYGAIIQKAQDAGKKGKEKKAETVAETPAPVVAAPVAPAPVSVPRPGCLPRQSPDAPQKTPAPPPRRRLPPRYFRRCARP